MFFTINIAFLEHAQQLGGFAVTYGSTTAARPQPLRLMWKFCSKKAVRSLYWGSVGENGKSAREDGDSIGKTPLSSYRADLVPPTGHVIMTSNCRKGNRINNSAVQIQRLP